MIRQLLTYARCLHRVIGFQDEGTSIPRMRQSEGRSTGPLITTELKWWYHSFDDLNVDDEFSFQVSSFYSENG